LNGNVKEEEKLAASMKHLSCFGIQKFIPVSDLNFDLGRPSLYMDSHFAVVFYAFSDCDGSLRNIEKHGLSRNQTKRQKRK
jgi:hypothetical protein